MEVIQDGRRILGAKGEEAAVRFLKKHGFAILERGFRMIRGEIDIIARDGRTLVFVEVKTRQGRGFGEAEEAVTFAKQEQIRRIAQGYLNKNRCWDVPCRFDVIAVSADADGRWAVRHIKDAF
jgi:putative endonuclease